MMHENKCCNYVSNISVIIILMNRNSGNIKLALRKFNFYLLDM